MMCGFLVREFPQLAVGLCLQRWQRLFSVESLESSFLRYRSAVVVVVDFSLLSVYSDAFVQDVQLFKRPKVVAYF